MGTERIDFTGAEGQRLVARLETPAAGTPRAYALFAHCFTCGKDSRAAARVSTALAERGIATLRFDFTGLGDSEGEFANTDFSSNVEDLVAAARFMGAQARPVSILVGHSLGGAAVLAAAGDLPDVRAVATIGAPFHAEHVLGLLGDDLGTIEDQGEATVDLAGRPFRIRRSFVEDARGHDPVARIGGLDRALLVMHAPADALVGVDNARSIYDTARHPKSFVALDGADHLLTRDGDAAYAATVLAAWASRYLPDTAAADEDAVPGVQVSETGGGLRQHIQARQHRLIADEPVDAGGDDSGPTPYDFLLAGLGACTAMTLRLYARRKGIALEHVQVDLDHEKIHASDCAECETGTGRVDRIRLRLTLQGALSDAEREALRGIAGKCPVHRTLTGEVSVETAVVE